MNRPDVQMSNIQTDIKYSRLLVTWEEWNNLWGN